MRRRARPKKETNQEFSILAGVESFMKLIGVPPEKDLAGTPERWLKAMLEMCSGYDVYIPDLYKTFDVAYDEMVLVQGIEFHSLCEHHLLPFSGVAHVAYIPKLKVIGLSKIARIVDAFSRRLQVQERLTTEIANSIDRNLDTKGTAVQLRASHSCMQCRGVRKSALMVTNCLLGAFKTDPATRNEFMSLTGVRHGEK